MFRPRRVMRRRAVAREEQEQPQEAHEQGAPPEPPVDPFQQLKELAELREQGILTEEEFAAEKKRLLGS